jgi:hypothetical protein
MHPYVRMGYGYELDISDDDIFNKIVSLFPEAAESFQDEDGDVTDFRSFLYEVREVFWEKYQGLDFIVVSDDNIAASYLIVDSASTHELYDKYGSNESGVIRPQDMYSEATEGLEKLADDLGLKTEPEILIWTYWS